MTCRSPIGPKLTTPPILVIVNTMEHPRMFSFFFNPVVLYRHILYPPDWRVPKIRFLPSWRIIPRNPPFRGWTLRILEPNQLGKQLKIWCHMILRIQPLRLSFLGLVKPEPTHCSTIISDHVSSWAVPGHFCVGRWEWAAGPWNHGGLKMVARNWLNWMTLSVSWNGGPKPSIFWLGFSDFPWWIIHVGVSHWVDRHNRWLWLGDLFLDEWWLVKVLNVQTIPYLEYSSFENTGFYCGAKYLSLFQILPDYD